MFTSKLSCAFVTGRGGFWANLMIRVKYALMRLRGAAYPDVYSLPLWLGAGCRYLANGTSVPRGRYDFIFSELNGSVGQLRPLAEIVDAQPERTIVLPGPPEVFSAYADDSARGLARNILRKAGHVWAYSDYVASFADSLAGADVARIIPWPFDYERTQRLARPRKAGAEERLHVLIGAPLRFGGIAANEPHYLEECIAHASGEMSPADRARFRFHAFVYTRQDKASWLRTRFGERIGVTAEPKRSYANFLRFVGHCDAVVQLSRFGILGRLTFLAAALGKPGIFSTNVELNRKLYPRGQVNGPCDSVLRETVTGLLYGLVQGRVDARFLPDDGAARSVGDYHKNAARVRGLLLAGSAKPACEEAG